MMKIPRAVMWLVVGLGAGAAQSGPIVTVGSLEWLQPADAINVTWNDLEAVCSPTAELCNNSLLGGTTIDGWRWESVDAIRTLINTTAGTNLGTIPSSSQDSFGAYAGPF